ncbi:uncharacterized protein LOC118273733 [Spodoptera frugiperda]|uniref:Uncharacterized protein LOC118273733 n=1 Tax=Spodoptera frugiperda TaxID=7108 RepID=A0A9R0DB92_SPOFR|nr:uncharacterized protein LOC118273733 [Spodoptera frugiperda]
MLWCSVALLALLASAQGRAVNISNTWVLPEEGFPVFYRYFRDRISWYEADAVCQFHHANLVTVDTTAQYDAVRAYLKELDISSAVWVGLIRSNPDGDFTWTDYRGLSGEGYWSSAPDARAAPLCAAADPAADYRWEARACGGPTVASFICELPVPQWALGNEGCMVRALPALTILYLPESAAVQLTADCGLAGVKRVQCTGNVKREDLLRDLACAEEEEISSTPSLTSLGNNWPVSTDAVFTDNDMTTSEVTTEDNNITTEHEDDINQSSTVVSTSTVQNVNFITEQKPPVTFVNANKYNRVNFEKNLDLGLIHNNNLQSNYIPKIANGDNYVTNEDLEKIEDEKHMQHKMLHEEIARLGNLENIFTQPTDHFVPPLVMAKAKISDDMTVLSLQEKHAQQMAEQHYYKQNNQYGQSDHVYQSNVIKSTTEEPKPVAVDKQSQTDIPKNKDDLKKDKVKSVMPKKYNEKLNDPKSKVQKAVESKLLEKAKTSTAQTETTVKPSETTPLPHFNKMDDESALDLTVFLKDEPESLEPKIYYNNFTGDVSKLEVIKNSTYNNDTEIKLVDVEATEEIKHEERPIKKFEESTQNITLNHEVIKITIISEGHTTENPTTFEITTKVPIIEETTRNNFESTSHKESLDDIRNKSDVFPTTQLEIEATQHEFESLANVSSLADVVMTANETVVLTHTETTENTPTTTNEVPIATTAQSNSNTSQSNKPIEPSSPAPAVTEHIMKNEPYNDEIHEEYGAMTNSSDGIDDFQSPLLSGANEPAHRPNRSRRPQQPNRNKFNPFRILG